MADVAIADEIMRAFGDKDGFFVYNSFGTEADTRGVIARLLAAGKRVYLPRMEGGDMLCVPYDGRKPLISGSFGIEEPTGQACTDGIEVCLTPLLAVNSKGYRLGYGGGYYDRFFTAHPKILKVGVGYYLQLTGEEFQEQGDVPLDLFVCERGIIRFER